MTHVQKCETDLIRCSGGAGSPEHHLPWSDSGGKLALTCVTWPWSSRGRGHFNDTCSEM